MLPSLLVSTLTMARLSPGILVTLRYLRKPTWGLGAVRRISGDFGLLHVITRQTISKTVRRTPMTINEISVTESIKQIR